MFFSPLSSFIKVPRRIKNIFFGMRGWAREKVSERERRIRRRGEGGGGRGRRRRGRRRKRRRRRGR